MFLGVMNDRTVDGRVAGAAWGVIAGSVAFLVTPEMSGLLSDYRLLIGANREPGQKLVRQAVKVVAVELGLCCSLAKIILWMSH